MANYEDFISVIVPNKNDWEYVLGMLEALNCQTYKDFEVIIVYDGVGSRNPQHKNLAIEQLRQAGAVISCAEIVIFQWTKKAATPTFKKILPIIK